MRCDTRAACCMEWVTITILTSETLSSAVLARGCIFETSGETPAAADFKLLRAGSTAGALLFRSSRLRETLANVLEARVDELFLINEQFIVKPAHSRSAFSWHRDAEGLCAAPPYVSLWIALDDVHEENGTLRVVPGSHAAPLPPPQPGDEEALASLALTLPAGSAVCLHSEVLHCSADNLSDAPRRCWMPQFKVGADALHGFPLAVSLVQ